MIKSGKTRMPVGNTSGVTFPQNRQSTVAVLAVSALCLALAGCGTTSSGDKKVKFSEKKYGVPASPKVVAEGKAVPKGGGRYMVGKPYKVAGKWYKPKANPDYKAVGLASWYGPTFHGRMTANGEIFDRNALTAAHTTMPLPSYARVTNLKNGRSLIVRVNDRGPFHGNRKIDLSERAATMLDYKSNGVAKVKIEYLGKARMDGRDHKYLMASYQGPGASQPGGTMPGTMLAMAEPKTAPALPAALAGPAPVPPVRPYEAVLAARVAFGRTVTAAFDPAVAYETTSQSVTVASAGDLAIPSAGTLMPAGAGQALPEVAPRTFVPGSAVSSFRAAPRIAGAYEAVMSVGGGAPLKLVALQDR
ncbi:septal ring lytic transglycosylase RlpA family protein [Stappia indica]|uniref:septal ring lytic transglycosylase RlpA family protein n=1 Tax=Stappia indica TaxID=538381 RepID=UPI00296F8345|nr:septal ring lytic transglycosylase RlpA family protein [Stappia indica]